MYQTSSQKIYSFFINLISKYIVWITIGIILVIWFFFPDFINILGKIALLWGPVIILAVALVIAFTANAFKFKRREQEGITQFEIIIGKYEIYLADLIIYLGSIAILIVAQLVSDDGVGIADLIQTLIFFLLANWVKQIFYRKISL
jgi:magnesium-transporting ATPase (P-type)